MAFQTPKTVEEVLRQIAEQRYLMPAIQREFVWGTDEIIQLFDSLLRGYPVGSFLFWKVEPETTDSYVFYSFLTDFHEKDHPYAVRKKVPAGGGTTAILDGQQRLTSLNIGLYGSHAVRKLYGRVGSTHAYPAKRLYLNLVDSTGEEELGLLYDLRFLTREEAKPVDGTPDRWFLVGDVLKLEDDPVSYMDEIASRQITNVREGVRRLVALYTAIHKTPAINYFLVEDQDPNKVLEIFIRVNSGGQKLTKSDLLLSMATNQWSTEPGAREEVRSLVTELNDLGFNFTKDFVLKTALVIVGGDVRFQVSSITRDNIAKIEASWSAIREALILTATLLKQSGYSARTLTANNSAIVVAYYLHKRGAVGSYLESSHTAADRDVLIRWVTRSLLKKGVWGSAVDTLLTRLRTAIDQSVITLGFPTAALETEMAVLGKALTFSEEEIDELLSSDYNGPRTFALLATLYPGLDLSKIFHEDHIFPKSLFSAKALSKAGIADADIPTYLESFNLLPNLQLLEGTRNTEKLAMLPADWIEKHFDSTSRRAKYLEENDLDELSLQLSDFLAFVDGRRRRIRKKLVDDVTRRRDAEASFYSRAESS
ncbi:DUF262 domain-containing protein [Cryobacterium ruanii]|uniref:DUF262 domain-containing protein n=1 Tax=Cryobacterium ruanii TaxID=1259197 RepID=A0A4R9ATF0_9MICO|nr:DUF262 domain-containing protein [Cryobacterium ruanii]TFD68496.1 DUF262 domain-containing protein [Cryobacterium ruanii]